MELETEDRVLRDDSHSPRLGASDADALAMAARSAWAAAFAPTVAPTVEVVVKKRRLFSLDAAAHGDASAASTAAEDEPASDERGPRVFVLPKDPALVPVVEAEGVAAAGPPGASPRRRRRASAGHRPSPVVHIVLPTPEPALAPSTDDDTDAAFTLPLPAQDEYKAAQAALARLRSLVQQASLAQAFKLKLPGR